MPARTIRLDDRAIIAISGEEASDFLQGIITNDIRKLSGERAIYAALLTPQGKYLFDFFIVEAESRLLLDCEADRKADLMRRLMLYRLRAKAAIEDASDEFSVWTIIGDEAVGEAGAAEPYRGGVLFWDPREPRLGRRAVLPTTIAPEAEVGSLEEYERHRVSLGVPDGARDFEVEKTLALEGNLDALGAIDFAKGCYVGQELTARTKHRGKVRRRLLGVRVEGGAPEPGTAIEAGRKQVGEIRSRAGDRAIASLRLDALEEGALTAAGRPLVVTRPDWLDESERRA